ncbi:acetyl-CoA carboxylase, carboxyl transferase, alpha subunit [Heliomicrobium modesticaldum Ice1]|uniref:Acetyl-coenzyme A carboxylase carboxyl transferase subunit alpha n=1 Tax=Heliobacterium modesticaldum (strain ATCC 51547 / Ice1) TaxID=498761 RepID=ACCA_HELMI|nr:acetyl-CoA carboxylase carboxyl transferase subunit alpha [Heliomicrobium modesticaldum]B0TI32.1 RecName: Full=Acetyl-coenzyme A carboxylase carboxyl transferase subunit alpha; Short=ACCase subunit alpha; Short=Acetyl-CoA carboxylase carboxyltransferase subunit alpha [Heliomicrobium modesticaldum Ice1]ABZ82705.1 acetyl-CoA carboxylase, carboxyl transferase, alpha subunit [Heliomicrobium modesticaldum Ice1]
MALPLDFEKPLFELETKIDELRTFSQEKDLDFSSEIATLEQKAEELRKKIYRDLTPWQQAQLARHPDRPNTIEYIRLLFEEFYEMKGDRLYGDDPAIVGGIARFQGRPVTVIGHVKGKDTKENIYRNFGMPHPEGYRKALRLMRQAAKFSRPIICFIDTPGAYCGIGAEERGQAEAIARNLLEMAALPVPIISVIIGEGGSGGALALGVADRLLMLEHAVYSVASPESAASILFKDASLAPQAAAAMGITAERLKDLKLIDRIVPEPSGGAHRNPIGTAKELATALSEEIENLLALSAQELVDSRYAKYRNLGLHCIEDASCGTFEAEATDASGT